MNDSIDRFSLLGLNAVVTGASRGLVRHSSSVLASVGATVFCCARRVDKLRATVETIGQSGGSAHAVAMNVTDRSVFAPRWMASAVSTSLSIPLAWRTASALWTIPKRTGTLSSRRISPALGWPTQEGARRMVAAKTSGAIINITSVLASRVSAGVGPYSASKTGLKHLTQSMALEYARYKIRINRIAPVFLSQT